MSNLSEGTHSFTANGTQLVYHVAGSGPVMIAHSGGPGVEHSYLRSPGLEEYFTMVYLEPAGTGSSGPLPAGATYVDTYVDFLYATVEHLDVPQVYLLGHSHGGFVALRFAVRYPERTAGLALYSTSPTTEVEFSEAARAAAAAYPQRHPGVPEAVEVAAAAGRWDEALTDEEHTAVLSAYLPSYFADFWGRRAEFEQLRQNIRMWATSFDSTIINYRPDLASITAPTVVIAGQHDLSCGPVWAAMLADGIPGAYLVILHNSGHFGNIEQPEAFVNAVTWLLDGGNAPTATVPL